MKHLITILLIFCVQSTVAQLARPQQSILIWESISESNGPGYGRNFLASTAEKGQRRARIYRISDNKFPRLHIGGANNAATFDTTHGVELQLANALDSGYFNDYNLYITKCGIGSTRISQWMPGTLNFNDSYTQLTSSLALISAERGVVPSLWCVISIGINDIFAGMSSTSWKDSVNKVLDTLHARKPLMKFIFTKFNQGAYTGYNTTIDNIASARSSYVFTVFDATAELRTDNTHWDYLGWKKLGRQMTTIIQTHSP